MACRTSYRDVFSYDVSLGSLFCKCLLHTWQEKPAGWRWIVSWCLFRWLLEEKILSQMLGGGSSDKLAVETGRHARESPCKSCTGSSALVEGTAATVGWCAHGLLHTGQEKLVDWRWVNSWCLFRWLWKRKSCLKGCTNTSLVLRSERRLFRYSSDDVIRGYLPSFWQGLSSNL